MAGSSLSLGSSDSTVWNADRTSFKTVTTYSVYDTATGKMREFPTYNEAATYMNDNGGSAALTPPGQQNISYEGSDPEILSAVNKQKAIDQGLKVQNEANATGFAPPPAVTQADPQAPAAPAETDVFAGLAGTPPPAVTQVDPQSSLAPGEKIIPQSEINKSAEPVSPEAAGFGAAYDEDGNLLPGYTLTENNDPVYVGKGFVEPATADQAAADRQAATLARARQQQTLQQQGKQDNLGDWRVKLSLAPNADYLYKAAQPGILQPLKVTNGVIFPYTPQINTSYNANYSTYDLTHSNYRGYFYQNSYVGEITITASFTAQDSVEANYLLAVIHFFRSVTKMFYGQDAERGAPPPLVFLSGLGEYQFNLHPCVVQQFTYNLPNDVDYIRANSPNIAGTNLLVRRDLQSQPTNVFSGALERLKNAGLPKGAISGPPNVPTLGLNSPTYVPTKLDMTLVLLPIQSRDQVSKVFSLKKFAAGNLIKGGTNQPGAFW